MSVRARSTARDDMPADSSARPCPAVHRRRRPPLLAALSVLVAFAATTTPAAHARGTGKPAPKQPPPPAPVLPPPPPIVHLPPAPPDKNPGHEKVQVPAAGDVVLAGTYASNGAKAGSPALLLVHGEGQNRGVWAPLFDALEEHRVPWLSIDLRGHGESRVQGGKDLGPEVVKRDETLFSGFADDVLGGITFLVSKGHDPKKVGVLGSQVGGCAGAKVASEHKDAIAALMMMTPNGAYPGLDTVKHVADTNGQMSLALLSSIEDLDKPAQNLGPHWILLTAEYARDAPPHTPLDEKLKKRRGIHAHWRTFAETNVTGTKMITGVAHFDSWLAAWWARRLGTYPHAVLYDGSVDKTGDYADTEWDAGVDVPSKAGNAKALRWGRRVMVGASLPKDVSGIRVRVHVTRGDMQQGGAFITIEYPSGVISTKPVVAGIRGRAPPTEATNLILQSEEIPHRDGPVTYGDPSFECEMRLPEVIGNTNYVVHVAWAVTRGGGEPENDDAYNSKDPNTWTVVPDSLEGTGIPYVPPGGDVDPSMTPPARDAPDK